MSESWIGFARDLVLGQNKDRRSERDRRKDRIVSEVASGGDWDLSLSDEVLAVQARNLVAAHGGELRLSDQEIIRMGSDVVWSIRFQEPSEEA